jgi:hypothetical protein
MKEVYIYMLIGEPNPLSFFSVFFSVPSFLLGDLPSLLALAVKPLDFFPVFIGLLAVDYAKEPPSLFGDVPNAVAYFLSLAGDSSIAAASLVSSPNPPAASSPPNTN